VDVDQGGFEIPNPKSQIPKTGFVICDLEFGICDLSVPEPALEPCYLIRDPHRGDTPMKRTWKMLGVNTLLAALLTAGPSPGQAKGPGSDGQKSDGIPKPTSESKKLDDIQSQLEELKKEVKKAGAALADIRRDLRGREIDANVRDQSTLSQINELRDEIGRLRAEIDGLRRRPPATTREAGSAPVDTATGRVEMVNTYPTEVGIVVNGRTYRVRPGEIRVTEPIPTGTFTYEVLNYAPQRTRTLAANKTYTIVVRLP